MPVADEPATAAARREARRASGVSVPPVPPPRADAPLFRAVLQSAPRAHMHVLRTRRLAVDATLGDAVVRAEVFGANRAAIRAGLTAAVIVPADDEGRRRAAAMRTRHDPGGRAAQRPLRGECRVPPPGGGRLELPLGALHQERGFEELEGMHDSLDLAAPDLFGAPALGERRDSFDRLRVGLLLQDRFEVPVHPGELDGKLLLRRGAA